MEDEAVTPLPPSLPAPAPLPAAVGPSASSAAAAAADADAAAAAAFAELCLRMILRTGATPSFPFLLDTAAFGSSPSGTMPSVTPYRINPWSS